MTISLGPVTIIRPQRLPQYLLLDSFSVDLPAGSVNGTLAVPGPGTRVVVDTGGNKLSVTGGEAVFVNATNWGDPGLWYGAITRSAGVVLIGQIAFTSNNDFNFGFDSDQASFASDGFSVSNPTTLIGLSNGSVDPQSATLSATGTYSLCVVLRTAGWYGLIKGEAFTEWTLLWISSTGTTVTLYPAMPSRYLSGGLRFIRIPVPTWLPTPLAYDTFARGDGALGNTETAGPDGQTVTALVWINRVGTTLVAGNAASASALVGGIAIATIDAGTADVLHDANLTHVGGDVGIVIRYADALNYVIAYHDSANAHLDKVVAGITTSVINAVAAYGAGQTIRVICEGTTFRLYYNNVQIGATSTINDAALQGGTEQGLYSTNVGNSQDDFQVFPRGTGNEYSALEAF